MGFITLAVPVEARLHGVLYLRDLLIITPCPHMLYPSRRLVKTLPNSHLVLGLVLAVAISGCGLAGWQGDAPSTPFVGVTGTMASVEGTDRGTIWIIEGDTASYVPKSDLPSQFRNDSLRVQATGMIGHRPSFYPEGYYIEIRSMTPLDEQ